jgi:hypothetical protein
MNSAAPRNTSRIPARTALLAAFVVVPLALACGGGDSNGEQAAVVRMEPCRMHADSILAGATRAFVRTADPQPHRYLIPVGTDSAIPQRIQGVLQAGGRHLLLYPADTAQHARMHTQLGGAGSYVNLLVAYHGADTLTDGRVAYAFSGHYKAGPNHGQEMPRTNVYFDCSAETDQFTVAGGAGPA